MTIRVVAGVKMPPPRRYATAMEVSDFNRCLGERVSAEAVQSSRGAGLPSQGVDSVRPTITRPGVRALINIS